MTRRLLHATRPTRPTRSRFRPLHRAAQRGAALLIALLTVTLIATFAATALWQQWRATEIEAAERARLQSAWVLVGALDWSRLILREDSRTGGADHLAEPWAVPLAEARLSSFLAADKNISSDALEGLPDAFLSGYIIDAQSRLNVRNLVQGGQPVANVVAAFQKLFELLGLPPEQVLTLASGLRQASPSGTTGVGTSPVGTNPSATSDASSGSTIAGTTSPVSRTSTSDSSASSEGAPLMPQRVQELVWLGLPASTVTAIEPYVTLLPVATTLNLNTASAEALYASVPDLDLASARRIVAQRQRSYFQAVADANKLLPQGGAQFSAGLHGISTQFFEVTGRLRLDKLWVEERSLLSRNGVNLTVLWRQRGAGSTAAPPNT